MSTNTVVLEKGDSLIIVDIPYNAFMLYEYVRQSDKKPIAVLLTHGHFDHCGGVNRFFKECRCSIPVFINSKDLNLARHAAENSWRIPAENCFPTDFVSEGPLKICNFEFYVTETPGHTSGSVVYLCENLMLSGDTLMNGSVGRTDFAESIPDEMGKSLQKLKNLRGDFTVIGGHGDISTLSYEKKNNPFLN